jgi:hypothetical protein
MLSKHAAFVGLAMAAAGLPRLVGVGLAQTPNIMAQKVVDQIKAAHPEITSLEVAATRSEKEGCKTVAATEPKEIGQKCDADELTAIKTNKPFIEEEKGEFDATLPIHDSTGAIIGTVGMDFKAEPGLTKPAVELRAKAIVSEFEKRITSRDQLFRPAE